MTTEKDKSAQGPPPPFSFSYAQNTPELLWQLNCSLAISTYQTGKVIVISPKDTEELIQLPRTFDKPMGMAIKDHKLAIATRDEVIISANAPNAAKHYPDKPDTYDSLYIPRATYYTGNADIHEIGWMDDRLFAVNTQFSCLSIVDDNCSFRPKWKPHFVSQITPGDRCHLNGVAFVEGRPKYVTALGKTDEPGAWRKDMIKGGVLMEVDNNEIVLEGLSVPHTPKVYDGKLYALLSGTGELIQVDPENGKYEVVTRMNGFARGMDVCGDYLFVALSKIRPKSSIFNTAPVAKKSVFCGVAIVYLPTGSQVGYIKYNSTVEEIFDIKVLTGQKRPNILNREKGMQYRAMVTPQHTFWRQDEAAEEAASTDAAAEETQRTESQEIETPEAVE